MHLDLERVADRQVLEELDLYLDKQSGRLVVVDEGQLMPDLFKVLRGQIDRRRRQGHQTGQFLLLGSASNMLPHQSAELLAGRLSYHGLTPFMPPDVGVDTVASLWRRGGLPGSFLGKSDRASLTLRATSVPTEVPLREVVTAPELDAKNMSTGKVVIVAGRGRALCQAAIYPAPRDLMCATTSPARTKRPKLSASAMVRSDPAGRPCAQ